MSYVAAHLQTSASPLMVRGLAIPPAQPCCRLWLQGQLCTLPHKTTLASSLTAMLHRIDASMLQQAGLQLGLDAAQH